MLKTTNKNLVEDLEKAILLKSKMLINGINIDESMSDAKGFNPRKYHLYNHTKEKKDFNIPEDTIIFFNELEPENCIISRNRINSSSNFKLVHKDSKNYLIEDNNIWNNIKFPQKNLNEDVQLLNTNYQISSLVTKLGTDLCGVILSNYCFYFKDNKQCKFCEIVPNFIEEKHIDTAVKKDELVINAFKSAIENEPNYKHMVMTSGNIVDYDTTFKRFINIIKELKNTIINNNLTFTATLMPPDDFTLINELKEAGCTNVYFDVEMFERDSFKWMVPGKENYGHEKMIAALKYAVKVFGEGHVFSNFVYGIQTFGEKMVKSEEPKIINMTLENEICTRGVKDFLSMGVIPTFTIYHYSGSNQIGDILIDPNEMYTFFKNYGDLIYDSNLVDKDKNSIIFNVSSTSNTLYNDAYYLSKVKNGEY